MKSNHEVSGGNVFADLGLPNAEERLLKAQLAAQIHARIREKGLTQAQAAELLEMDQADVSRLLNGKLSGFSVERLLRFLGRAGYDVSLVLTDRESAEERIRVPVACA